MLRDFDKKVNGDQRRRQGGCVMVKDVRKRMDGLCEGGVTIQLRTTLRPSCVGPNDPSGIQRTLKSIKRPLMDKGIKYILETCRALCTYAGGDTCRRARRTRSS